MAISDYTHGTRMELRLCRIKELAISTRTIESWEAPPIDQPFMRYSVTRIDQSIPRLATDGDAQVVAADPAASLASPSWSPTLRALQ